MTHILDHTIFRYTWELVRHTYLVDLESEIEIRQVEISPLHENRLLDPPYPFTPFFEIEIDQIQKNGKTVFSFRNICPVEINRKPFWNFLNPVIPAGGSRVTKRFQSQDGETETRWLYADDFFLISLSSGDRHDLGMLVSLILGKLNMIALSIQSGRRIRSEFENQQKYREAMNTMFSDGVDGAFQSVPVYVQHGEVTGSDPEERPAPAAAVTAGSDLADRVRAEYTPSWSIEEEPVITGQAGPEGSDAVVASAAIAEEQEPGAAENIPSEDAQPGDTLAVHVPPDQPGTGDVQPESARAETDSAGSPGTEYVLTDSLLAESEPAERVHGESLPESVPAEAVSAPGSPGKKTCDSCGAAISVTTKFCGRCGTAVSPAQPAGSAAAASGTSPGAGSGTAASPRSTADIIVDLKPIEELQDLSWLSD